MASNTDTKKIDYIKRVQSLLRNRKVLVSRGEIRDYMTEQGIDFNHPTEEQLTQTKEYFLNDSVVADNSSIEITPVDTQEENVVTDVFEDSSIPSESSLDSNEFVSVPDRDDVSESLSSQSATPSSTLATPEKQELVSLKAQSLGIQLTENQVTFIADSLDASNRDFSDTLVEIENALLAYIEYQHSQESQAVDGMMGRVINKIEAKNQSVSRRIDDGLVSFKTVMEAAEQRQFQQKQAILERLKLPA